MRIMKFPTMSPIFHLRGFAPVLGLLAVLAAGCREKQPVAPPVAEAEKTVNETEPVIARQWPPQGYAKVVGYRFWERVGPMDFSFSLLSDGRINRKELDRLKVKSAELTSAQVDTLVAGLLSESEKTFPAACYEPHHIFLFLDRDDQVLNAAEVCFDCCNIHLLPAIDESRWARHDFRSLAKLCEEIGIGMHETTAAEFIKMFDEQEAASEEETKGGQ